MDLIGNGTDIVVIGDGKETRMFGKLIRKFSRTGIKKFWRLRAEVERRRKRLDRKRIRNRRWSRKRNKILWRLNGSRTGAGPTSWKNRNRRKWNRKRN
ncbi:hypothetical protein GWI33_007227 [Rhynchophorus ferrugineus]|uniref:Uncharacterized protein n=1 Tax=Rhynchophorus ferrugineus TaxID=354439 RepID=A0A834MD76_RHYFE|nr:hypothetical protein GWI33_007227 [Rhynchophorus ferrugineus]